MTEISDRYATIADGFARRVDGTSDWDAPSPCPEWNARDVVTHVVATHRGILSKLAETEQAEVADGTEAVPVDEVKAGWRHVSDRILTVLADPDQAGKVVPSMFGEAPFDELVGGLLCADTLVHTWDLARATGQDDQLDRGAVDRALAFLTPLDEHMRAPGGMGPKVEVPDGTDDQSKLIAFMGRDPS